jgi:hypothetical protein
MGVETIIHVGAHKTGTSLIQNALKEGEDQLLEAGVRFSSRFDPAWQQHDVAACVKAVIAERVGEAERTAFAANAAALRAGADRAVIIPAEGLLDRPPPPWAARGPFSRGTPPALTHLRARLMSGDLRRRIADRLDADNEALLQEFGTDLERRRGIS